MSKERDPVFLQPGDGFSYLILFWPGDGWRALKLELKSFPENKRIEATDITMAVIPNSLRGDPPPTPDREPRWMSEEDFFGLLPKKSGEERR